MYFPYFRGRQYEMLALKELATEGLLGKSIIPVVEPVKLMSTFDTTLRVYLQNQYRIALVFNPTVGDFAGDSKFVEVYENRTGTLANTLPALLMSNNTNAVLSALTNKGVNTSSIVAFLDNRDFISEYRESFESAPPSFTLLPDESGFRRTASSVGGAKIMFKDNFTKKARNADYPEESFFTDDHLYYAQEGYAGFGDYSVIGSEYVDGGFAPYAVAIHIVYFDDEDKMRVRHFKSDSNEDISDVQGKFGEAVSKLADWYYAGQERQLTHALSTLLQHAKEGYYPGLPTIKKLSIMHHLELVGKYLDGGLPK